MAKKKATVKRKKRAKKATKKQRKKESAALNYVGLALVLIAVFSIFTWGFLGNLLANTFRLFVGNTYLITAVVLGITGLYMLTLGHFPDRIPRKRVSGMLLVYLGSLILNTEILFRYNNIHANFIKIVWAGLVADFRRGSVTENVGGGLIGATTYTMTYFLVSNWGTIIVAALIIIAGLLLFAGIPFKSVARVGQRIIRWLQVHLTAINQAIRQRFMEQKTAEKDSDEPEEIDADEPPASQEEKSQFSVDTMMSEDSEATGTVNSEHDADQNNQHDSDKGIGSAENGEKLPRPHDGFDVHFTPTGAPIIATKSNDELNQKDDKNEKNDQNDKTDSAAKSLDFSNYKLPTPNLLSVIPPVDQSGEVALIKANRLTLAKTFQSFGVEVKIIHADLGPTVTKYEVKPGPGVKVNKIVNLADDLALALAAKDIRIEAPIPGKPYVGIEVPNRAIATVSFRDVIEKQPHHPGKVLEVPLGKSVTGEIMSADLTKMPHLLIAGSTGSGKSVMINVIITSILMHARPDEVKLMLIDPKMVELSVYNEIPHLLLPVVTNPKKAANALNKAVSEMEDRYQRFEAAGVRDIGEYNRKVIDNNSDKDNPVMTAMPYLVIVIDELADLMMAAGNEVETSIVRLAQKARAAGVHLIIATQRPSVDVITGLIKANIPSRIAFAVSSGIDSRTILDMNGAEKLLGRGDMMFSPVGLNKPVRIQGAYISGHDVDQIVNFVKDQQPAEYDQELIEHVNAIQDEPDSSEHDEHFDEAVSYVIQEKKASTSMIQRRFRIGYNRAALIVEDMEKTGVVGPSEGSKGRQVLWSDADYQRIIQTGQESNDNQYLS